MMRRHSLNRFVCSLITVAAVSSCASDTTNVAGTTAETAAGVDTSTTSVAPTTTAPTTTTTTATSPNSAAPATTATLPDTPAGEQLRWVLEEAATADDAAYTDHFAPSFIAQVPISELRTGIVSTGATGVEQILSSTPTELVAIVAATDGRLSISIVVDAEGSHQINGLLAQPADFPAIPATWEDIDTALAAAGPVTAYLAAEVRSDGTLNTLASTGDSAAVPLGSSFKLYVLGALVRAIDEGTITWDEQLTITEDLKSLPSGELQDRPAGSMVTVREAAEKMIQISDNTATDILINRLGRDAVEAMLPIMGLGESSRQRTLPFITTKELFTLKWGLSRDEFAAYAAAGIDQRRQILTEIADRRPDVSRFDPAQPIGIDTVEWFATPAEIAAAHIWLDAFRGQPGFEPLGAILGSNPGVPLDSAVWSDIAFKGGSEPGVVFLGWLLHRTDGRRFVVVVSAVDEQAAVAELQAATAAAGIIDQMARG